MGEVIIGYVLGEFRSAAFAGHGEVVGELDQEEQRWTCQEEMATRGWGLWSLV